MIKDADDDNGVASALPNPALLDCGHHEREIPVLPKLQVPNNKHLQRKLLN